MTKYVYSFGGATTEGSGDQRDLLGGKGLGLAVMSQLGIRVPPGLTLTTEVCKFYQDNQGRYPETLEEEFDTQLACLEREVGQRFGDPSNPLLLSVRSGAPISMPGML